MGCMELSLKLPDRAFMYLFRDIPLISRT